jgi:translation initiation factor IF-1
LDPSFKGNVAKEELLEFERLVTEILPDARYRVQPDNGHQLVAYAAVRMKKNRILAGDRVTVEVSPYDSEKWRLIFRHKDERVGSPSRPPRRQQFRRRRRTMVDDAPHSDDSLGGNRDGAMRIFIFKSEANLDFARYDRGGDTAISAGCVQSMSLARKALEDRSISSIEQSSSRFRTPMLRQGWASWISSGRRGAGWRRLAL